VGWAIATNARIGFKLQVTAMPQFHSLNAWCYQAMWLFSTAPEDPEDETVMEMHGADALYISKMYFSHWEPPGVSKRRRSVNLEASISGENQTLGRHSGQPSE
jgi:hypothetical protein